MLSTTINAYLYQQYADDANLQAFIDAYNAAAQAYVGWFASVGLPFYPGLSTALLDWVAYGLYGLQRTSLESPLTAAVGPYNTVDYNTTAYDAGTQPTRTYYSTSDDVFQRILTWNIYKADGKRFTMLWLKRRIMRFLVGTAGLDPTPPAVGAEDTSAISVVVNTGTLTVTIDQTRLSELVQVAPGIPGIFQAAFLGDVLELPLQYTYECVLS